MLCITPSIGVTGMHQYTDLLVGFESAVKSQGKKFQSIWYLQVGSGNELGRRRNSLLWIEKRDRRSWRRGQRREYKDSKWAVRIVGLPSPGVVGHWTKGAGAVSRVLTAVSMIGLERLLQ